MALIEILPTIFCHYIIIDEIAAEAIVLLMTNSMLSILSMRSSEKFSVRYENISDMILLLGLILLFITIILIAFNVIE